MRLINVNERMPTERDSDSAFEVAWVVVYAGPFGTKNIFSAHNHWTSDGMRTVIEDHAMMVRDLIEVFWVELSPQESALPTPTKHVRKVEL